MLSSLVVAWLFLSFQVIWTYTHPRRVYSGKTPADYGLTFAPVRFRTADGLTLAGWWLPVAQPKGSIVLAHGHPTEKGDVLEFATFLTAAGYQVLLFDFRYYGESQGSFTSLGDHERLDVRAAVTYLKSRPDVDPGRLGALGFSFGAVALLLAGTDDFKAIVADSPFVSLRAMGVRVIRLGILTRPLVASAFALAKVWPGMTAAAVDPLAAVRRGGPARLFIHGLADSLPPAEDSRRLHQAAAEPKDLWLVPEAGHVQAYDRAPEEYRRRVLAWFDRHLAGGR